jgi:hypothetical protein
MSQSPETAAQPARAMKTVLAAIDFSPVSRAVIAVATELARAIRGRIVLITPLRNHARALIGSAHP